MSKSKKKFSVNYLSDLETIEDNSLIYRKGWEDCKQEVIKILQQDLQNLDLSTDSCDSRYIEKIKDL